LSRIISSRDAEASGVSPISLDDEPMPTAHPGRPRGGVEGVRPGAESPTRRVSVYQHRRREAEKLIENARAAAERIQKDAYHEGFSQGEAAGRKLTDQKLEPILKSIERLIVSLGRERETLVERYEAEIVRLALLVAARVVHREIEADHDVVLDVARDALAKVVKAERISIKVSPFDLDVLRQATVSDSPPEWMQANVSIEGDFQIGRGGCKVLTDAGEIDATIETQIRLLKTILWSEE
jgi:flagellar assembly protein FliH